MNLNKLLIVAALTGAVTFANEINLTSGGSTQVGHTKITCDAVPVVPLPPSVVTSYCVPCEYSEYDNHPHNTLHYRGYKFFINTVLSDGTMTKREEAFDFECVGFSNCNVKYFSAAKAEDACNEMYKRVPLCR